MSTASTPKPPKAGKAAGFAASMLSSIKPSQGFAVIPPQASASAPDRYDGTQKARNVLEIPVDKIVRDPDQPRVEFDEEELARLAQSLRDHGLLQPIRVRWDEGRGKYVVLAGERRWRAAQLAGFATLTASVDDPAADRVLEIQLVENALRVDLNPVEKANAYRRLMDAKGWSQTELAEHLSLHKASVSRTLALLGLPAEIQVQVEQGQISPSAGAILARVEDPAEQAALAVQSAEVKVPRKSLRADAAASSPRTPRARPRTKAPVLHKAQKTIEGGTIWIQYQDDQDLGLLALLKLYVAELEAEA